MKVQLDEREIATVLAALRVKRSRSLVHRSTLPLHSSLRQAGGITKNLGGRKTMFARLEVRATKDKPLAGTSE